MDTPGVMLPNVPNEEVGMRLALTGNSLTPAVSHASQLLLYPCLFKIMLVLMPHCYYI